MQVVRLRKEHYTQLISLLNFVFTRQNQRKMDFEKELPKMCVADDEHIGKHFGVFQNEKLVAVLGAYPLKVRILDEELLAYTVGNIATHPDWEGKGYMQALLSSAMQELEEKNADLSRLEGLRQRYERFGYEPCGSAYQFRLTPHNVAKIYPKGLNDVVFERIEKKDLNRLQTVQALHQKQDFFVERKEDNGFFDLYATLTAWKNVPYIATKKGEVLGYVCVSQDGAIVSECGGYSEDKIFKMLCAWQAWTKQNITIQLLPNQIGIIRLLASVCQTVSIDAPSQFKIIKWEKVVSAFFKLKASYTPLQKGEYTLDIENYGGIKLFADGERVGCERYDGECEQTLSALQATRFLFGTLPSETVANSNALIKSWLPLPLSWNLQDRG